MTDLVTLAEVKAYSTITSTNQDTIINQLIPQVSTLVKNYCGRSFVDYVSDNKIQIENGGYPEIYLDEIPLIDLVSFEYSLDYGVTYTAYVENQDFAFDIENDRLVYLLDTAFPTLINGYKITYKAGYVNLPEDLKLATLDLVQYYLKSDMSVKSNAGIGKNSVAVEYITTAGMPSHIRRVLDLYRLVYF